MTESVKKSAISRRAVVKSAAWAAPVVAVAASVPLAAASDNTPTPPPPRADYLGVRQDSTVAEGTNVWVGYVGQYYDGTRYREPATIPSDPETTLRISFGNGVKVTGYSDLVGLVYLSGGITTGGIIFKVVGSPIEIGLLFTGVTGVGKTMTSIVSGGVSGTATTLVIAATPTPTPTPTPAP